MKIVVDLNTKVAVLYVDGLPLCQIALSELSDRYGIGVILPKKENKNA